MFHTTRPANFSSTKAGTICFLEHEGKFLLMKRGIDSYEGGKWTAAPGGKVESGETPREGVVREVREETGIELDPKRLTFIQTVYFQFPGIEYALHLFYFRFKEKPLVLLDQKEHTEYDWGTLDEALKRPIMQGGHECIAFILQWLEKKEQDFLPT